MEKKKEYLYVFNQSYFVEHYGNVSKESIDKWMNQCIDTGYAFRVNSGYEWRRFIRDIDKTNINIMFETFDDITCLEVFTMDAFDTLKNMYFKDVKKVEESKMIKTNYELDTPYAPFEYAVSIAPPINGTMGRNLIHVAGAEYRLGNVDKVFGYDVNLQDKYKLSFDNIRITKAIYNNGCVRYLDIKPDIETGKIEFRLDNGKYIFTVREDGASVIESSLVSVTEPYITAFTYNFNLIERENAEQVSNELTSSGPWHEPDKVKAIRETIEEVMKNHNTTDIREIDLDMLSSCINATLNREKMYYKWLNEFTSDEVSEDKIKFAFKFFDWVLQNKTGRTKDGGMYFVE